MQSKTIKISGMDGLIENKSYLWNLFKDCASKADFYIKILSDGDIRTLKQNKKLWPALNDISKYCDLNGVKYSAYDWKTLIISGWQIAEKGEQVRTIMGLENELVPLNYSTSKLGVKDFASMMTYMFAYGDGRQVPWSDPSLQIYQEYQ